MKKMFVFPLLFVVVILFVVIWTIKINAETEAVLPVFKMSDKPTYDKLLLVRRISPDGNLLLKLLNEKKIFQYDIGRKSVSEVDEQSWNNASEKVSVCGVVEGRDEGGAQNFKAYGKYVLTAKSSPREVKFAVLSAAGPKIPNISIIPFMGGGHRILGTRYLEIKENSADYKTVGKPFRVEKMISPQLCWTEDETLVVMYDSLYFDFSVANLNQPQAAPIVQNVIKQAASKPDLSRLTGNVRDYGVDENGDGLFEKIAVEIETETSVAGKYQIFLSLKSKDGKNFIEAADVELKGGLEMTKLLFDTKPWFEEKVDGAFKIEMVDLTYQHYPFLERREDLGQTREYKLAQFSRPNIVFTAENIVTPIDKNHNGKYEGLQIKVGIDVLDADDYKFQGDLYDEFSDVTAEGLIEFGSGEATLKKGKGDITFYFSGKKIIEHGISGRFRLKNIIVYKKGRSSDNTGNLLTPQSFDVKQFESEN